MLKFSSLTNKHKASHIPLPLFKNEEKGLSNYLNLVEAFDVRENLAKKTNPKHIFISFRT